MQLSPYLMFKGQCEEAFRFYETVLGGRIEMMLTNAETPEAEQTPPEWRSKIAHARLALGKEVLLASDAPPGRQSDISGVVLSIAVETAAEVKRIHGALVEGGTVTMPVGETFFALQFGMLVDRYGVSWMVICPRPA